MKTSVSKASLVGLFRHQLIRHVNVHRLPIVSLNAELATLTASVCLRYYKFLKPLFSDCKCSVFFFPPGFSDCVEVQLKIVFSCDLCRV